LELAVSVMLLPYQARRSLDREDGSSFQGDYMANPYHDETGRFCAKDEMGQAVERTYQTMVAAPAGPAQEEAANAWFNLRNEFEAAKKQELDESARIEFIQNRPVEEVIEPKNEAEAAQFAARNSFHRRTERLDMYSLPRGGDLGKNSLAKTDDQRSAVAISNKAIYTLVDGFSPAAFAGSNAVSIEKVKDQLREYANTFSTNRKATDVSIDRVVAILNRNSYRASINDRSQEGVFVNVLDAIRQIEDKTFTVDLADPNATAAK
jgi:hypothetical protein